VLAVPQSSILYDGGQPYVFVVQDVRAAPAPAARGRQRQQQQPQITHVVHRANLTLGARDGEHVEVLSGLDLNQRIVGSGAAFLQDGDTVAPLAATAAVPARTAGPALRGREG
jgi:hypothetical protein